MKQKLREFIENCLKIKVHDESATQIPLKGKWQQFNYYASFGKGAFAYVPWLGFFAFNQVVTKGIYPVILYNTKANNLNFEVCYGISATSAPDIYWNVKYTQNLQHSNTPKYTQSFVKKSYTINTIEDFEINADDIIQQINSILNDFNEQFSSNDSEEQLLESLILQYASFKNSAEYDEQYKWDYASKHKNEFDNLDDFENKINGLGNYNFRPYFLQRTGQNHLMEPYNIETFKSSLKILLDESVDLEQRINKFLENLRSLLKNDEHWNNKDMMPDETDASYFLFTNDYTKYLLFNPKTAFNNFAKKFNLSDLLDKNDRVKRYIKIQDYCNNVLLPKMNSILNKTHTLLDAQDFIRYVDNINSVENLRAELLEYYTDLNFTIDDTPNDYTAIKNEKNIAEVHRVNSKNTKFRVIINYDKLPENMRDNCKRVPDSYGWTLNGECWVTSRNSLDDVIRKIDSTLSNLTNKSKKYWIYQPGEQGRLWNDVYANDIIAIGWEELGNLKQYSSKDTLAKRITEIYSKKNYPMNDTLANWEFANIMDIGDIVYVKKGVDEYLIGRGIVQSDYYFDDTRKEYKSVRKIKWTHNGIYNVDFSQLNIKQWNQKTLTDISEDKYKDFCLKIEDIFMNNNHVNQNDIVPLNQILYGPPGTGKTYKTKSIINNIIKNNKQKKKNINFDFSNMTWHEAIAIGMYNHNQEWYSTTELKAIPEIQMIYEIKNNKNLRAALWAYMQQHTSPDIETVKYSNRYEPFLFEKNTDSKWKLTDDGRKYVEDNLSTYIQGQESDEKIEYCEFITFHQSYAYEDFIEGIKPDCKEDCPKW